MSEANPASPRSQRLIDEATGQPVQLVYALPPELLAGPGRDDQDQIRLGDLLRRLWRRRRGMAAILAAACALAVILALTTAATWKASVTAIPPAAKSRGGAGGLGQYADLASLAGISLPGGGGSPVEEIMAILQSRTLQAAVVTRFGLAQHYGKELEEDAVKAFAADFTTVYDKKASTISFAYCTRIGTPQVPDQAKLAEIVNAAAVVLQDVYNRIHQSSSRRERDFLEGRLTDVQGALDRAQAALADFQRENRTIQIESQAKATVEAISTLEGTMIGQQVELRALLASQASADNPSIRLIEERISGLNDAIKRLSGAADGNADDRSALLHLGALPELGIRYFNLLREVKKNEAIVQALIAQVEAARFNELRSGEVISIIDEAVPPQRRSSPKRGQMCMLGFLLGALAAVAWALAIDPLLALRASLRAPPAPAGAGA